MELTSLVISPRSARLLRPQAVQTQAEHLQEDAAVLRVRRVLGDRARRAGVLNCVSCVGGAAEGRPVVLVPAAMRRATIFSWLPKFVAGKAVFQ